MPSLSEDEVRQLASETKEAIASTDFACSSLSRIPGGSASFIFRGDLVSSLSLRDGAILKSVLRSVVVKKATNFAAVNRNFALDSGRSRYEHAMLEALAGVVLGPDAFVMSVITPLNLLYLPTSSIQIIEDLHPALDCASLLTSHGRDIPLSIWSAVGFAIGEWLHALHHWTQEPTQDELRSTMGTNRSGHDLKLCTTFSTIVDIASTFPAISEEDLDVLREVKARAESEHDQGMQGFHEVSESYGIVHGDLWAGNVLLSPPPQPRLHVIDFELSHLGHRSMDLGQMIGDLLEKISIAGVEARTRIACKVMIEAFAKGYGVLSEDMAHRVNIYAGVHVINWCARHPGAARGSEVDLMFQEAVELVVRSWRRDRSYFKGKLLGCLFAGLS